MYTLVSRYTILTMSNVLFFSIIEKTYDPLGCSILSKVMAQEIKGQVEELDLKR